MTELRALTGVRGLAAWLVVLYHLRLAAPWLGAPTIAILAKGYLAVDFFFLLSGFVIWLAWHARFRDRGFAVTSDFLRRRVARVWPLHLFMLGCAVLFAGALAATGRADPVTYPPAELPLHILLIQNWGFTSALAWNDPAWSISAELGAYLLFPLLVRAVDWRRLPTWIVVSAIAALLLLLHAVMATAGADTLGVDIPRFGLLRCVLEFAAGTALGALWLRWRDRPRGPAWAATGIGAASLAGWAAGLPETLAVPFALAAGLFALALTAGARRNPLDLPAVHWLGQISYATYLGHFMLWRLFKLIFVDDPRDVPPHLLALYLILVLMSSALLYRFVERPAQRFVNGVRIARTQPVEARS